jgi:hypothetical protein
MSAPEQTPIAPTATGRSQATGADTVTSSPSARRASTGARPSSAAAPARATDEALLPLAAGCVLRVIGLLARRQLHLHRDLVGATVVVRDGRQFRIYRESSSSEPGHGDVMALAMWFHLRWMPPGARLRAFLFERESMLNTVLYAGFEGYRAKLWTVDRETNDYAGFYLWRDGDAAERYARYAMRMLRPLSVPGSVGCRIDLPDEPPSWAVQAPAPARRLG